MTIPSANIIEKGQQLPTKRGRAVTIIADISVIT